MFGAFEGEAADILFGVFDDNLIHALVDGLRRAAERDRAAGLGLQAEGGEFQRMGHRHGVEMVGGNQVAQFREALAQAGFEVRQV